MAAATRLVSRLTLVTGKFTHYILHKIDWNSVPVHANV